MSKLFLLRMKKLLNSKRNPLRLLRSPLKRPLLKLKLMRILLNNPLNLSKTLKTTKKRSLLNLNNLKTPLRKSLRKTKKTPRKTLSPMILIQRKRSLFKRKKRLLLLKHNNSMP